MDLYLAHKPRREVKSTVTLDERTMLFLDFLVYSPSYVSIEEIAEKLQISKRKIYYDLEKINSWLESNKLDQVHYYRTRGFYLSEEVKEKIPSLIEKTNTWQYFYSPNERKMWLMLYLIIGPHKLLMNDLITTIRLSRGTIHKELEQLKKEIIEFDLLIIYDRNEGYVLRGKERDQRRAFAHYIFQLLSRTPWLQLASQMQHLFEDGTDNDQGKVFIEEYITAIYQAIQECEQDSGIQFTDEMLQNLAFRFAFYCNCIKRSRTVTLDKFERDVVRQTSEYRIVENMIHKMEKIFDILFPEDEICYITIHILSAKVNHVIPQPNGQDTWHTQNMQRIIQMMVDDIQKLTLVFFTQREELENNLFLHFKPAYYRIKYGLGVENPLTETIKQKYKEIFEFTKKSIVHFENYVGKKVSDEEAAFVAMHFGGWMRRQGADLVNRMKAIIVCPNGISTSRIVQNQLEHLFPLLDIIGCVSLREYETHPFNVDFFFSTTPLDVRDKPVFLVSAILTEMEKDTLVVQVNNLRNKEQRGNDNSMKSLMEVIKRHAAVHDEQRLLDELTSYYQPKRLHIKEKRKPMINDLITEEMIQIKDSAESWQEAIRQAAIPLLNKGKISSEYVEAMIGKVDQLGPYFVMGPKIAFPHARPDEGVKQLGISLLCLKESVSFSKEARHQVNLLFVIAAIDNETHLKALTQLSMMLSDTNNVDNLLKAESTEPIMELINKYSTD